MRRMLVTSWASPSPSTLRSSEFRITLRLSQRLPSLCVICGEHCVSCNCFLFAVICSYLRSFAVICSHLQLFAVIFLLYFGPEMGSRRAGRGLKRFLEAVGFILAEFELKPSHMRARYCSEMLFSAPKKPLRARYCSEVLFSGSKRPLRARHCSEM